MRKTGSHTAVNLDILLREEIRRTALTYDATGNIAGDGTYQYPNRSPRLRSDYGIAHLTATPNHPEPSHYQCRVPILGTLRSQDLRPSPSKFQPAILDLPIP